MPEKLVRVHGLGRVRKATAYFTTEDDRAAELNIDGYIIVYEKEPLEQTPESGSQQAPDSVREAPRS
ncbi:hypothetical protein A2686_03540 [Candidatus Woesebacteria bacterium RIFCSPHIGHO2_01_FULL_38_10]|uniref:Uncharacterized protein n=1 Tax=Candidatus Woesebacteria bacterium RIFCSPLOWO2_01_FULL_39_10b TaxID=1802517 RepID=A0A1F8B6N4_9BACT|nr:MAG: hypothetical protein A2686_03540 [Candidatus Woesebacteria bacterium RIFCSPHIGHO2_01_FULL_38_10]OGM59667.1 MAG: hypothetical protein A2892_04035 [Candidatus Woesebacteria bacterium RIFCSPLOWO2_01_FULL_39_10b]